MKLGDNYLVLGGGGWVGGRLGAFYTQKYAMMRFYMQKFARDARYEFSSKLLEGRSKECCRFASNS